MYGMKILKYISEADNLASVSLCLLFCIVIIYFTSFIVI